MTTREAIQRVQRSGYKIKKSSSVCSILLDIEFWKKAEKEFKWGKGTWDAAFQCLFNDLVEGKSADDFFNELVDKAIK